MSIKPVRITALGVLAALAAAPSAHAALAGGQALSTETRPDLQSVSVRATTDSVFPKHVTYCFDEAVKGDEIDADHFRLEGYDSSSRVTAFYATLDLDNPKCVIASFPANTVLENHTVGTVRADGVENVSGNQANLTNAMPLADSGQRVGGGLTTAPDLTGAMIDPSFNRIVLTFDSNVEPGDVLWDRIAYYDPAGNKVSSDGGPFSYVSTDDKTIVFAHFPATDDMNVRQAVRVALEDGATRAENDETERSVRQSMAVLGQDGYTARPDLLGVKVVPGKNAVDFTFDHAVSLGDVSSFELYRDEERRYLATSATVLADDVHAGRTVRAFFNNAAPALLSELTVASVDDEAVLSTDAAALGNTVGSKLLGASRAVKGFTSAPDVSAISFDFDDGTATLEVDQPALVANLDAIRIVDRVGNELAPPLAVVDDGGFKVVLLIGAGMAQQAAGVVLEHGALAHAAAGDLSVRQAIGRIDATYQPGTGPFDPVVQAPVVTPTPAPAPAPKASLVSPSQQGVAGISLKASGRVVRGKKGAKAVRLRVSGNARRARVRIRMLDKAGKQVGSRIVSVATNKSVTVRQGVPRSTTRILLKVL